MFAQSKDTTNWLKRQREEKEYFACFTLSHTNEGVKKYTPAEDAIPLGWQT